MGKHFEMHCHRDLRCTDVSITQSGWDRRAAVILVGSKKLRLPQERRRKEGKDKHMVGERQI